VTASKVSFDGQVVVITGAARGIGAATARLVAARGGKVFALDIARDGLNALQSELGLADNQIKTMDLGSQESVQGATSEIFALTGRIDALINTAGVVGPTNVKVEDVKWADFESTVRINLFGTVWLTQAVIPFMKKAKYGRIAHVASIAGKEGNPGMTPYNVSKSGMIGWTSDFFKCLIGSAADHFGPKSLTHQVIDRGTAAGATVGAGPVEVDFLHFKVGHDFAKFASVHECAQLFAQFFEILRLFQKIVQQSLRR